MLKISNQELKYLLKALVEHKAKLERIESYPSQGRDLRPYDRLIQKLTKYRAEHFKGRTQ